MFYKFCSNYLALFIVALLTWSCSKLTSVNNGSQGSAVSAIPMVSSEEVKAIYPHTVEFKSTRLHGQKYIANVATCKVCHGQDLSGAASRVSCKSCHDVFPHTDEFKIKTHGSSFLKDRESCARCHGADFQGGTVGVSCKSCHNYPHEPKWALPKHHGAQFVADSNAASPKPVGCQNCHSTTAALAPDRVSCDSCHVMVPHGDDFINGGHMSVAGTHEGGCLNCHTNYTRLMGKVYSSCNDCHAGQVLPPMTWVTPSPSPSPSPSVSTSPAPGN